MKVPYYSSYDQTVKLNTLLHKSKKFYEMGDVFNYLPHCISFSGRKGYLTVTKIDIYWTTLELGYQGSVVGLFQHITSDRNVFDSFIDALEWLQNNDVEIIEQ
jgi:hypothetical protein